MSSLGEDFSRNVFINCPFDSEYIPLLRPLLFTVIFLEYNPRIASERFDSGEARINKICSLIQYSKYSIHDISRIQSSKKGEYYRLNMPLELGIDIGCRLANEGVLQSKTCLILEKDKYRYQKALSDLSNSDIKSHNNDPETLVLQVRNWFTELGLKKAPSATRIWERFNEFMADFSEARERDGFKDRDLEFMPVPEYLDFIKEWIAGNISQMK
ncbi:MAG: hypothetical protein WAW37_14720 [Syntrophobacteraceae bacterium]